MQNNVLPTLAILESMITTASRNRDKLRDQFYTPTGKKELEIRFSSSEAVALIGRSITTLKKAEAEGKIPPAKVGGNNRRYYTLDDLGIIRHSLGIRPGRAPGDDPVILTFQNFKGGVSKTTCVKHCADYLGLRGYRTLVIDSDAQGSTTTLFDINPDLELGPQNSLAGYMQPSIQSINSLRPLIHKTVWPTVDIIPANLSLQDAEYELTATARGGGAVALAAFRKLKIGLEEIIDDYDVVLIDPPPAMGYMAINTMVAANAMIIPCPARHVDFCSTIHFMTMMKDVIQTLAQWGEDLDYKFLRILCSGYQPRKADNEALKVMQLSFSAMIPVPLLQSDEIKSAAQENRSIYELAHEVNARRTHDRIKTNLDAVFGEVENLIRQQWPSHSDDLMRRGVATLANEINKEAA